MTSRRASARLFSGGILDDELLIDFDEPIVHDDAVPIYTPKELDDDYREVWREEDK